ncbi:uncharacterized protein KIAA1614 homolog isoform X2 [Xenopus tropicalis]|uniref:Uncharacterized protein KIAA1614 homolog isoform X2 n=1 Tax=Xenopus tropicalis TaxID=8364 RepID=A0A8J0SKX7_XENTR|nr:uncharacterized protein KIAA1614 homolog isoform X2 [Xenopus tropicalis]|eukprot:XP_012817084.1 PREDICTED: uncharacterized protein KIAA1614 homolog isoform X2 [Xenopus tropicalis]
MAAEVNMRECLPHKNIVKRQVKKDNMILERTSNDYTDKGKPVAGEMEPTMGTSVLQSKVKALKQKHKDLRISEFPKGKDPLEDTLNVPQLRTYLTEDTLNYTEHGKLPCVNQESWGTENVYGSSSSLRTMWDVSNECEKLCDFTELLNYSQNKAESNAQKWPQDHLREFPHELLGSSHTEDDLSFKSSSMSLAERVERNRQELRWKFNGSPCFGGETSQESNHGHTSRQDSWLVPGADADCDSGVSLPDPEGNRELSIRHEQAKQLLHRARMKAKGASPLRASHCVLPHALSQLPQQRGPCVSGAVTDGGSLSDSSGSDHCSWHRSSRGSSPSHVRFQDESERDVEERYRERQQQGPPSAGISPTTPPARRSNGHVSWTQHLVPFGNENQCGTCGSYIKGSGVQRQNLEAYSAGSNLWNVHLGSRISQDGSINSPLGTKPSPHWILPSQPWRVHSELIRETHIGGDSTADSSGEDEVNRAQKKSCRTLGPLRSSKNKQHNVEPGSGARTSLPQSEIKSSTSALMIDPRTKISESNPETETAVLGNLHNTNIKLEKQVAVHYTEPRTTLNPTNAPLKFGNECLDASPNPGALTIHGHVPVPPAGKAPSAGTPRSGRFAVRSEGAFHHLPVGTSHGENMEQVIVIEKGIPSDTVPKNKNQEKLRVSDIHPLSLSEIKMKEEGRERTQKVKKLIKKEKPNERQEQRNLEGPDVTNGQAESERAHKSLRQRYSDRKNASKEQRNTEVTQTSGDHADRAVSDLLNHHLVKEINNGKREHINAQRSFTGGDVQHESTDSDVSASEVGSAFCGATLEHPVHDRQLDQESGDVNQCVTHKSSMQPAARRGDIRSGMKKILSSFGLASRPKLERFQSSSLEQIFTPAAGSSGACVGGNKERCEDAGKDGRLKKSPSLQSLKLVTQFHLPRKASSVQNLLGKSERSAVYLTEDANTAPRRALSVEDIGSPGMPRVLGRVAEVYPDGTRLLQLQRPPQGSFGFSISSVNGRPDSGIYVQEMSDASTAKLFSSLLRVGDEILELNGTKVSTIAHEQLSKIMDRESTLSLRVLHQRRTKC